METQLEDTEATRVQETDTRIQTLEEREYPISISSNVKEHPISKGCNVIEIQEKEQEMQPHLFQHG